MKNGPLELRRLLAKPGVVRCAGAHNPAGAKVAEVVGFDAVWSSSFEISASYCVPDASVLSMSDYLHIARSMTESVTIPVIADCDTGYGNAINVTYAVKKFEASGIAGMSIEDQVFPKANSLIPGAQHLVSIAEFKEKIRAAVDSRTNSDFLIIARVEALIAGAGQAEAQLRAHEYAESGADAILIHWNQPSFDPIQQFLEQWTGNIPIVVVPTTYYKISLARLNELGAKMVIYANQGIRGALKAMEEVYRKIIMDGSTAAVEQSIWPVQRIFEELQGATHLVQAPKKRLILATTEFARGNGHKTRKRSALL